MTLRIFFLLIVALFLPTLPSNAEDTRIGFEARNWSLGSESVGLQCWKRSGFLELYISINSKGISYDSVGVKVIGKDDKEIVVVKASDKEVNYKEFGTECGGAYQINTANLRDVKRIEVTKGGHAAKFEAP